jgi:hypothetical protein
MGCHRLWVFDNSTVGIIIGHEKKSSINTMEKILLTVRIIISTHQNNTVLLKSRLLRRTEWKRWEMDEEQ